MERLILEPEPDSDLRPNRAARLVARLESTGEVVVRSNQPLVDGARELIASGFDPATLLTMRHAGKSYDSFRPVPIGELAKWTYSETGRDGLRRQPWASFSGLDIPHWTSFPSDSASPLGLRPADWKSLLRSAASAVMKGH